MAATCYTTLLLDPMSEKTTEEEGRKVENFEFFCGAVPQTSINRGGVRDIKVKGHLIEVG